MAGPGAFGQRLPAPLQGASSSTLLSGGRTLFEPDVALMRKPLGVLDKQSRQHMQLENSQIHEILGVTVVYLTHDQSEALTMSNRIAVFNDGVIRRLSKRDTLQEAPKNSFVAPWIIDSTG